MSAGRPDNCTTIAAGSTSVAIRTDGEPHALTGFSARETSGAAAVFRIHDSADASGPFLTTVSLAASESVRDTWAPDGIQVSSGALYLERVSGSCELAVYWA